MTEKNREVLDNFVRARHRHLLRRLIELRRTGVFRQTVVGNLGLLAATTINRL